jgi:uncharacterized membrane protein required for colicin V production
MWLDIITVLVALLAFIHGFRKGFFLSLFTFLAWIIGMVAAIALGSTVTLWLHNTFNLSGALIPIIAFILILLIVHFLIIQAGILIEKLVSILFLGWLSKLLGGILLTISYLCVLSLVYYFMRQGGILSDATINQSRTYSMIEPWGIYLLNEIAIWWPAFENQLLNLETILKELAQKIQEQK